MLRCGEITDRTWEHIEPLLPRMRANRGGRWRDPRTVVNGILHRHFAKIVCGCGRGTLKEH
jgi:transposase